MTAATAAIVAAETYLGLLDDLDGTKPAAPQAAILLRHAAQHLRALLGEIEALAGSRGRLLDHIDPPMPTCPACQRTLYRDRFPAGTDMCDDCLTGDHPHRDGTLPAVGCRHCDTPPPALPGRAPHPPAWRCALCRGAFAGPEPGDGLCMACAAAADGNPAGDQPAARCPCGHAIDAPGAPCPACTDAGCDDIRPRLAAEFPPQPGVPQPGDVVIRLADTSPDPRPGKVTERLDDHTVTVAWHGEAGTVTRERLDELRRWLQPARKLAVLPGGVS